MPAVLGSLNIIPAELDRLGRYVVAPDAPNPHVRWLSIGVLAVSGLSCLGFGVVLPLLIVDDPTAVDWLTGMGVWWPLVGLVGGIGLLQLVLAGWGVWSRRSAGGAV